MTLDDFMKPRCPVAVGDRFYKKYHVQNSLNFAEVTAVEEAKDEKGTYYIVSVVYPNIVVGVNTKKFDSRMLKEEDYVFLKRGIDF